MFSSFGPMLDTDAVALRAELEQERALTTLLLERLVRCDDAACAAAATDQTGSHLIGCRVEIYWAKEKAWFAGEVVSFDTATGKVTVAYDDGDRASHVLSKSRWRLALRADAKLRDVPPLQTALNDALSGRITEIISRLRNRGGTPSIAAAELRLTAEPTRDPITGKPADFYFIEPPHKPSLAPAAVATQLPVSEVYMKSNVTLQQRCALGHGEPTQHIARVRCGRPDSECSRVRPCRMQATGLRGRGF